MKKIIWGEKSTISTVQRINSQKTLRLMKYMILLSYCIYIYIYRISPELNHPVTNEVKYINLFLVLLSF